MPKRQGGSAGIGPYAIAVTTTGSAAKLSSWHAFGPCLANSITVGALFSSTVGGAAAKITVQGWLSTQLSTAAIVTVASRTVAQRTSVIQSTVATVITRVRLRTTGSTGASITQTAFLAAGE